MTLNCYGYLLQTRAKANYNSYHKTHSAYTFGTLLHQGTHGKTPKKKNTKKCRTHNKVPEHRVGAEKKKRKKNNYTIITEKIRNEL